MSSTITYTPGMRVLCRDAEWVINRVEPSDHDSHYSVHCTGADDFVRGHNAIFLTQLDSLIPVDPRKTKLVEDTSSGFKKSKLFLEAQLRQMPSTLKEPDFERMGAFQAMNFQKQTVHKALNQLRPRLLLADAVGLGKTIQVGMVISELMRRGQADRILVLAKKSMLQQFQSELWNRFAIPLVRLDSNGIGKLRLKIPANKNPFEVYHRIIISMDTLKDVGRYSHFLEDTHWDVVVIDEAHNVAGASIPERNLSNRLARLLSRRSTSMLLTTATPHNGKKETFGRLISLLDPSAIPDPNFKEYEADDIKDYFLMRFKEDIKEEAKGQFAEREVIPLAKTSADATADEETIYDYLKELRAIGKNKKQKGYASLLQYGLYKSFLSSPEACLSTISKRLELLIEDQNDTEVATIKKLKSSLSKMSIQQTSRYKLLIQQLRQMGWSGKKDSPRVLIFTESRRTQDALASAIANDFKLKFSSKPEDQSKQELAILHGEFPDVYMMETVEAFGTGNSPLRMLLTTDVASEGLNLHHECHLIIHYDLPWSIITLIQRNGRIDRFGQLKEPKIRYLIVNTKQGLLKGDRAIFERLIGKVEEINKATRAGETVLKLYDPEKEEEYIAEQGILGGKVDLLDNALLNDEATEANDTEKIIYKAKQMTEKEFLDSLLNVEEEPKNNTAPTLNETRLRLFEDMEFFQEGYHFLKESNADFPSIKVHSELIEVTPPKELKRYLGDFASSGDVIFGATAIPDEAWPEEGVFRLTKDSKRVELAITAARKTKNSWTKESLVTDQHPFMKWVSERLIMVMERGQAPIVTSKSLELGETCFCFIGQVSSRGNATGCECPCHQF